MAETARVNTRTVPRRKGRKGRRDQRQMRSSPDSSAKSPHLPNEPGHVLGRLANEVKNRVKAGIGRGQLMGAEVHLQVHLVVVVWTPSEANEAAATDPVARLKKGHPGLRRHSERSRGALFDLVELCVG